MNVAFFGTPEFALPSLTRLASSRHPMVGVVTAPDKPRGRGREIIPTPVAEAAQELGLPLLKPADLDDPRFHDALRHWCADIFAVVAFRILPETVFSMPRYGSVNLHGSLLPAYRGAAPIQWALWNGEKETGVTTFQIQRRVDTGNILIQRRVEILDKDDAGSLGQRLAEIGAELLLETISRLEEGTLSPTIQSGAATLAPKITPEHCIINWNRTASQIRNQIRALSPHPGAVTTFEGQALKLFQTEVLEDQSDLRPGELRIDDQNVTAGTGSGQLRVVELQLQGRNRMNATAFLRGFRPRGVFNVMLERE